MEKTEPKIVETNSDWAETAERIKFSTTRSGNKMIHLEHTKIQPNSFRITEFPEIRDDGVGYVCDAFGRRRGSIDYETGVVTLFGKCRYHCRDTCAWVKYWYWRCRQKALDVPTSPATGKPYFSTPKKSIKDWINGG